MYGNKRKTGGIMSSDKVNTTHLCAKMASDMVSSMFKDDMAESLRAWRTAFKEILKTVNEEIEKDAPASKPTRGGRGGRNIPMVRSQDEIKSALEGARGQQKIMIQQTDEPKSGSAITINMFDFKKNK